MKAHCIIWLILALITSNVLADGLNDDSLPSGNATSVTSAFADRTINNNSLNVKPINVKSINDKSIDESKFMAKLAVVDVESVYEHSLAIKHIKKSINEISAQIQRELTAREIELKSIESSLVNERDKLTEEQYNKRGSDFNNKVSQAQKEMQSKKAALETAHSEAIEKVNKAIIDVIADLSKKHGYNIVLPSSQIMFVENNKNITLEVITNLNERLSIVEVKYLPIK